MNVNAVIDRLKVEAQKSDMRHRHAAAVLDSNGNVLSVAHNKFMGKNTRSKHAETEAIKKAVNTKAPRGRKIETLIVVRVNKQGKLRNSEPCQRCKIVLDGLDIKVIHS